MKIFESQQRKISAVPFRWYATKISADLLGLRKGYFGLKFPTAVHALIICVATVCSMKPSMGRAVMGSGCFFGGNLWGNVRFQYFSGNLKKQTSLYKYLKE